MTEYAYSQNDNEIILQFQEDGAAKDLSAVTKIEIQLFAGKNDPRDRVDPAASFNTVDNAAIFDTTDLANGNLTFTPGPEDLGGLTEFRYFGRCIVYSADYPNGIVWTTSHDDLFEFIVSR